MGALERAPLPTGICVCLGVASHWSRGSLKKTVGPHGRVGLGWDRERQASGAFLLVNASQSWLPSALGFPAPTPFQYTAL